MIPEISIPFHSSIRLSLDKVLRFDPYCIEGHPSDADIIFITHSHYDHFSPDDIKKVIKPDTSFVVPESMRNEFITSDFSSHPVIFALPGDIFSAFGIQTQAVAAYNIGKPFHPKSNNWLGYVVTVGESRCYIAGDTDITPENRTVNCDIALVPVGGKYTMDESEAAELVNYICPGLAIPTHYGQVAGRADSGERFKGKVSGNINVSVLLGEPD